MWFIFLALIVTLLVLDLGVFHRKAHVIEMKEALVWTAFWIGVSLLFNVFVYVAYEYHWLGVVPTRDVPDGREAALLFFAGYIVEKSLSVDNVLVIALIFSMFRVPAQLQHRVLFWGIVGALVMRGTLVLVGAALIERFQWILYIFGAFLVLTAAKMLFSHQPTDPKSNWLVRLARRLFPISDDYAGQGFTARVDGKRVLTPLALALVAVESTDLIFAVDSIPAIFAITQDPFLVFSSNAFALLGMRSLYFALASVLDRFYYLKATLCVLLAGIGVKMLLKDVLHDIPGLTYYTLGGIALVLTVGVGASLLRSRRMFERREESRTGVR